MEPTGYVRKELLLNQPDMFILFKRKFNTLLKWRQPKDKRYGYSERDILNRGIYRLLPVLLCRSSVQDTSIAIIQYRSEIVEPER